ncbi:MAG: alpha/beta hydrolase [Henriciella sp.]|nr:alpha/beta hydrolase [Henriciella sp.]
MRRFTYETPEGDMSALEFGNPADRLAALWLHATGFNAMTYQSILAPLGLRTKVQAVDLRGHGRSTLPANPGKLKSWNVYRNDVIGFLEREAPTKPVVLGGHSMGGCVALMVAAARPEKVAGLVLVDPVILPPTVYRSRHLWPFGGDKSGMSRQARRRRAEFGSQEEIIESYTGRGAFKTWREPFLHDYLLDAFDRVDDNDLDSEDQTWRLLCHPRWEAATFSGQRHRPWQALSKVRKHKIPITILRPEHDSVITDQVAMGLNRKCPHLVLKERLNSTHFLPMEAPYDVRDQLSAYISSLIEGLSDDEVGTVKRSLRA